jgi:CRISPR-associated exonuclease Cas4
MVNIATEAESLVLTVTDLKQYAFCPRVVYYVHCLPLIRPVTYKMDRGITAHEDARSKARRRTLAAYNLKSGQRHFEVNLESQRLALRGRLDLVIETSDNAKGELELIPVEYKNTTRDPGAHWKQQLAAYGMMLEESWGIPVRRGFFYLLPRRRAQAISISARLCTATQATLMALRAMPPPPKQRRRCVNCEFRRFCNDVL